MNVGELIEILSGLPPDLEVILKTSSGSAPLDFNFSDRVDIVTIEVDTGDSETFVMLSEEEVEPQLDIIKFLN